MADLARVMDMLGNPRLRDIMHWFEEQRPYEATQRERELDRYERYYWGLQYDDRTVAWDGRQWISPDQRRGLAHPGGVLASPPPWYYRRPFIRRQLCRAIVDRFTDLLFGEDRLPSIEPASNDGHEWIHLALKISRWWERWSLIRTLGGAMGSVVAAVKLRNGTPVVEVINAKWCRPLWHHDDPDTRRLAALEVRYVRPVQALEEVRTSSGLARRWVERREWYRRLITPEADVVMTAPLPQGSAATPLQWRILDAVEHGLGFVPARWITNTEVVAGLDGAPDCDGLWDALEALDALYSDAFVATHYSADPTLVVKTLRQADQIQTGSQMALVLHPDESAELLELRGSGGAAALEQARALEKAILEDAHCVLTPETDAGPTATAVIRREAQMLARADQLRRQYGAAMEELFEDLLRLCRAARDGLDARLRAVPMPSFDDVTVVWPRYVQPSPQDEELHVRKVGQARAAGLVSRETALKAIARFIGVTNPEEELERLRSEEAAARDQFVGLDLGDEAAP